MTCPVCCSKTKVIDSYATDESVVRVRRCRDPKCAYKFKTVEYEADEYLPNRWDIKKRGEL